MTTEEALSVKTKTITVYLGWTEDMNNLYYAEIDYTPELCLAVRTWRTLNDLIVQIDPTAETLLCRLPKTYAQVYVVCDEREERETETYKSLYPAPYMQDGTVCIKKDMSDYSGGVYRDTTWWLGVGDPFARCDRDQFGYPVKPEDADVYWADTWETRIRFMVDLSGVTLQVMLDYSDGKASFYSTIIPFEVFEEGLNV